ncbi:hypothetical protein Skr01_00880 [Sphaerisporangium krabiense]|nr:hypothetical protein Skr01_00880 [Sphaerisporangium krabiense]
MNGDSSHESDGLSVPELAESLWGVRPEPAIERFAQPGWTYREQVTAQCPRCHAFLHTMWKADERDGRNSPYVAVVCRRCPATFTLDDLRLREYADLLQQPGPGGRPAPSAADRGAPGDTTVAGVAQWMWGVRPSLAVARFALPGWRYLRQTDLCCPTCDGALHGMTRAYQVEGARRAEFAVVCPACPATFTLQHLRISRRPVLGDLPVDAPFEDPGAALAAGPAPGPAAAGHDDAPAPPPGSQVAAIRAGRMLGLLPHLSPHQGSGARDAKPSQEITEQPPAEHRLLHWCKITNPRWTLPPLPPGTDVRVILPDGPEFGRLRTTLAAAGVPHRSVAYWAENEIVSTVGADGRAAPLSVITALTRPGADRLFWRSPVSGQPACNARDAFEKIWDTHEETVTDHRSELVPAADLVPQAWLDYLPFDRLNPAQVQAAPAVLNSKRHLVITAPTGAGKTVIGMLAVLRAILGEGRKAAWLVPQRSLTDELDRELEGWRGKGLRVERLSGEYTTDIERIRAADLWVATTEKFEAICRTNSLQAALGEVGCLVVDEVHLLGSPGRGPLLEALLARVRGVNSPVRIVGLSATVSNAAEIAEWLNGRLISTAWRPSRLTWQLPAIPVTPDQAADNSVRNRLAVVLARRVTDDGGSVLVFCGSKRNVRVTALALAAERGVDIRGVDDEDIDRVNELCTAARIGLHYKDWEFKHEAEARFRSRDFDVLVATTTVAAGVNLPARAVIVRDTMVGRDPLDVATLLQMFGRAGRVGAGEHEGWAYLITSEVKRADWQGALVDGYHVHSQIHATLTDHVLAEVVQGRITSVEQAEQWWKHTLCHHQGDDDTEPVIEAVDFLIDHGYLTQVPGNGGDTRVAVTDLGLLTARLMVNTDVAADLRAVLGEIPVPSDPDIAEDVLIHVVAALVPELAFAPVADFLRPVVAKIIRAGGRREENDSSSAVSGLGAARTYGPGDLARAALLLAAHSPRLFTRSFRFVAGLPSSTIAPILEAASRYFAWLGAQGYLGTMHPWIAIVAGDIDRRVRWRRWGPRRGSGRLLWMCEQMATAPLAKEFVPTLWRCATESGFTSPDWAQTTPPRDCQLDHDQYIGLLRERTTGCELAEGLDHVSVTDISAGHLITWNGRATATTAVIGKATAAYPPRPPDDPDDADTGGAIFTKRGDHMATGWLGRHYSSASPY